MTHVYGYMALIITVLASTCPSRSDPISITAGGIYTGQWSSTNDRVPAVSIHTSEPVTLDNCVLRGIGTLIFASSPSGGINLTVRNCYGYGSRPIVHGRAPGHFVFVINPHRIIIEHASFDHTRGIRLQSDPGNSSEIKVTVRYNLATNMDSRCTQRCSLDNPGNWVSPAGDAGASFVQLVNLHDLIDSCICWNEVSNQPGESAVEDNINIYNSSGTQRSPLVVSDNFIWGGFPGRRPFTDVYNGSGIMLDGDQRSTDTATAWVNVTRNHVVGVANAGVGIAAGHNNTLFYNRIVRSGIAPDGQQLFRQKAIGAYIWFCCVSDSSKDRRSFYENIAVGNTAGVVDYNDESRSYRNDFWFPDCASDHLRSRCVGNNSLSDPITRTFEDAEYLNWKTKLLRNSVTVGVPHP